MTEENKKIQITEKKEKIVSTKPEEKKTEEKKEERVSTKPEEKQKVPEEKKTEEKKDSKPKKKIDKKPAKEFIISNLTNIKISTKYAISICKFIKNKTVEQAILDLEQVVLGKKAVPMKGEIPHRHGKGIMSGRFPERAAKEFISVLKNAAGNAASNGIDEPVIVEAIANIGNRPYAKYGVRRKRTHLKIQLKNKVTKK